MTTFKILEPKLHVTLGLYRTRWISVQVTQGEQDGQRPPDREPPWTENPPRTETPERLPPPPRDRAGTETPRGQTKHL